MFLHLSVSHSVHRGRRSLWTETPHWTDPPPYGNEWAVRILLQCIRFAFICDGINSTSTLTPMNNVKSITILFSLNFSQ